MVESDWWLALVDSRDAASVLADRFGVTARTLMCLHFEGRGYRRWPGLDPCVPGGPERYRALVFEGSIWGVDTSLFRWSSASRLSQLPDRLGVGLEFWPGVPGVPLVPWRDEGDCRSALAEYRGRLAVGAAGIWASLAGQPRAQASVDEACALYHRRAVPAYVGALLYSDEYVIDRRVGGPFAAIGRE
jgi:hypothetical protein